MLQLKQSGGYAQYSWLTYDLNLGVYYWQSLPKQYLQTGQIYDTGLLTYSTVVTSAMLTWDGATPQQNPTNEADASVTYSTPNPSCTGPLSPIP